MVSDISCIHRKGPYHHHLSGLGAIVALSRGNFIHRPIINTCTVFLNIEVLQGKMISVSVYSC